MKHKEKGDVYIVMWVPQDVKSELTAISYHMGKMGKRATVAKQMIKHGIEEYKSGLSPKERAAYDTILENVRVAVSLNPPKERKKQVYVPVKTVERGGI